jgi:hypothetical protein
VSEQAKASSCEHKWVFLRKSDIYGGIDVHFSVDFRRNGSAPRSDTANAWRRSTGSLWWAR